MEALSCYATNEEIKNFAINNGLNPTILRHAQVCYLYHVEEIARAEISRITGYAVSTLSTLKNKVLNLMELAKKFFISKTKKIVSATFNRVFKSEKKSVAINILENAGEDICDTEQVYLFKFYNPQGEIVFSKIGTSGKSVIKRLRDEIGEYSKKFSLDFVDVCKIYPCGEMPAESYESMLRALLIKQFPGTWKRNDRFFGVDIPTERFEEICENFKNMS